MARGKVVIETDAMTSRELHDWLRGEVPQLFDDRARDLHIQVSSGRSRRRAPQQLGLLSPSQLYTKGTKDKLERKDWRGLQLREIVAWWAWVYAEAFGEEDDALRRDGSIKRHEKLLGRNVRLLGSKPRTMLYLSRVVAWWAKKRAAGDEWPKGLPDLATLLQSDKLLKLWQSGDIDAELGEAAQPKELGKTFSYGDLPEDEDK